MKNKITLGICISILAIVVIGHFASGCGGSSSGGGSNVYSYNGPGSEWTMDVTGSTYQFDMTDGSDSITVTATGEVLATGHIKMTVTSASATGSATAPSPGDVAYAIEVPGTAFLLLPNDPTAEVIAMVSSGVCPSTDFTANWIIGARTPAASSKITDDASDWFGTIVWDTSGGSATFPYKRSLEDPTTNWGDNPGVQTLGTCSGGRVSVTSPSPIEAYFTPSGLVIVATQLGTSDESHIIGIPESTIAPASSVYGNYIGFLFDEHNGLTLSVTASFAVGTGTAGDITIQVKTGANLTGNGASYVAEFASIGVDTPSDGMMIGNFSSCTGGSVTDFDGNCEIACNVSKDVNSSGKNFIYCVGQHPSDEDDRFSLLLITGT